MIKLTTLCRNIATVLTLSVLLTNPVLAQEPGSIFQLPNLEPAESMPYTELPDAIPDVPEDLNILTRGPLHEAFASVHQADPQSSELIFKAPPELIDEIAPEYKPEGNNVQWISGYWAWDDSQSDFIWISGIWRDVPPTRRWIPGYWNAEGDGYRWVSGFWAEETQLELGYGAVPPASIDQGPSTAAPSEEHFYVPGNWQLQDNSFRWLAGHWQPIVENWIWVPSRYVWTPNGCVYQSGYWDYELQNRGTCFAPVHFSQPLYLANDYSYRPSFAINLNVDFLTHLFVRPRCGHYFYGDWYTSNFNNVSYRPWVSFNSHYRSYDPLLTYYHGRRSSFDNRYNVVQYLTRQHNFFVSNRDYRPRPTYKAQYKHARKIEHRYGNRGSGKDYIHKANYVNSYKNLRKREDQVRRKTADVKRHLAKKHHKVAAAELRRNQLKKEQLAQLQRERKRRELAGRNQSVRKPGGKQRTQNIAAARNEKARRVTSSSPRGNRHVSTHPSRNTAPKGRTAQLEQTRNAQQGKRAQQDKARRAQQEQLRKSQQANARKAQQDKARRTQQDQVRKAQQVNARRQQEQSRKAQQDRARRAQQDQARKAQQANARRQQEQSRKAQQDRARRTQQDQARKAQQDKARRAQQDLSLIHI